MDIAYIVEDIIKFLPVGLPMACVIYDTKVLAKAKLQRKSFRGEIKYSANSVLSKLPDFYKDEIDYTKREILRPYVEKLCNYISLEDMKLVRRNMRNLKVEKNLKTLFTGCIGYYDFITNEISYRKDKILGHEFLHMASTVYNQKNDVDFCGFSQSDAKNIIGTGLNEGYTELLNSRIYGVPLNEICYSDQVRIARMLELFFDDEKEMTHLYFSCDLLGVIRQLEKYAPREEIIKLIIEFDDFNVYSNYNGISLSRIMSSIKISRIYKKIYKWFSLKSDNQEKLIELEKIIKEDKIASIIVNKEKMKLYKDVLCNKDIESSTTYDSMSTYRKR